MARIQIKGLKECAAKLKAIEDSMGAAHLGQVLFDAIDLVRAEAVRNAQAVIASHTEIYPHRKLTGKLVQSMQSFKGKSRTVARAYTKAKYSERGMANHAHLVEYGHRISRKKLARIKQVSVRLAGLKVGNDLAPPHPFFRPALMSMRKRMRDTVKAGCLRLIKGAESVHSESFGPDMTGWVG